MMPKTYSFEGKQVTVPDDATMDEVQSYFNPAPPKTLTSMEEHHAPHSMGDVAHEAGVGLGNVGAGGLGLLSTIGRATAVPDLLMGQPTIYEEAAKAIPKAFASPVQTAKGIAKSVYEHPLETGEMALGAAGASGGLGMMNKPIARMVDPLSEYRSPLIPRNEAIARSITDQLKPNPAEYRNVMGTMQERIPAVRDYLRGQGVSKVGSPLEFAKGASGAGKEATDFFKQNLIEPNANVPAGSGTVGSVYGRLGDINDELRPIYKTRTLGEQWTKETADHVQALERERDNLNNVLYSKLSERSGMPIEQIQDINQRGASLQHTGDVADAAQQMRRAGYSGYTPQGLPMKGNTYDAIARTLNYLRGGPEAVAGRRIQRLMNMVNEPDTGLPSADFINKNRIARAEMEGQKAAQNVAGSIARKPKIKE